MGVRESNEAATLRWAKLTVLQDAYPTFEPFLVDVMENVLGFQCTDQQIDIGGYLEDGPQYRMIQAQRGEAKTTITAIYAVWRIIHAPSSRVLIVSAGEDMAVEIGNWVIQILNAMPELECLRADRSNGDRASVEAYDIHYTLKGPEKSPSLRSMGITANLQGKRADILVADDIESKKNSKTALTRAELIELSRDFSSICSQGDIIYLGTPQSTDSVYNTLPARGFDIRIYPGRYPTVQEEKNYGPYLAPIIRAAMEADPSIRTGYGALGDSGAPTDPIMMNEDTLVRKEIDQGKPYFQLQHMLNTTLADEAKFPLKASNIRWLSWDTTTKQAPMSLNFSKTVLASMAHIPGIFINDPLYRVLDAKEYGEVTGLHMHVDPAGGGDNRDEVSYAVTGAIGGRVLVYDVDGRVGGLDEDTYAWLTDVVIKNPNIISITVEENYGNGAMRKAWEPLLRKAMTEAKQSSRKLGIEDIWEQGQKELRIIDVLEPLIGAGKLIANEELITKDIASVQKYPAAQRKTYSWLYQLARISKDKGALIHDDRLDALAAACRVWIEHVALDSEKAVARAKQAAYDTMMKNPFGDGRPLKGAESMWGQRRSEPTALGYTKHQPGRVQAVAIKGWTNRN